MLNEHMTVGWWGQVHATAEAPLKCNIQHMAARTKWLPFCRQHFQMHFKTENFCDLICCSFLCVQHSMMTNFNYACMSINRLQWVYSFKTMNYLSSQSCHARINPSDTVVRIFQKQRSQPWLLMTWFLALKATRLVFRIVRSLWNLTGTTAAVLPRRLPNFRAMW